MAYRVNDFRCPVCGHEVLDKLHDPRESTPCPRCLEQHGTRIPMNPKFPRPGFVKVK